ncbi:MAG TPA: Tim44-like domain-containing protein [Pyrinomonadaceae bacterium]|nr:Tim44-like domain-containing protein [Pyrinomonadaceae bacterium]
MRRPTERRSFKHAAWLAPAACAGLLFFAFSVEALARVGGGQGYGGGGSNGGGDGEGLGYIIYLVVRLLIWLTIEYPAIGIPLDIIFISAVIYYFLRRKKTQKEWSSAASVVPKRSETIAQQRQGEVQMEFGRLRRFDPNFSEIIFTDFCYALYGRAHHERATKRLDELSPYISQEARNSLLKRNPPHLQEVRGVIVGAMKVVGAREVQVDGKPFVNIAVEFEANYTEVLAQNGNRPKEETYYVRERWLLERKRDVLTPPPAQATALHCPRCGAALQKDTVGACAFCGTRVENGEFQWFVRSINLLTREARGPMLTGNVPEVGTDAPTVVQRGFGEARAAFEKMNPNFQWGEFMERARLIFNELQTAWSTLEWERARPHETDNIFQMHRYWIEAYKRQGLRNALDDCRILSMQPAKITGDAFYNAITLRIGAEGYDYTVDSKGKVVAGSKRNKRRWTEYWTFIRNRNANPLHSRTDLSCPNCGAPLKVNVTGICEFCGGKVTSGEFDWVLSKIEQDESYTG